VQVEHSVERQWHRLAEWRAGLVFIVARLTTSLATHAPDDTLGP